MTSQNYEGKKPPIIIRAINFISEITGYISGFCIFLAALIVTYKVLIRYFLNEPTIWQTEMSIYLLMFGAFIGAAYGLKHDSHVGVDVILERLSTRASSIMRVVTSLLCMVVTIIVAWRAWNMWWHATTMGWHSDSLWGPPLTYPYFILPFGMTLVTLQFIVVIYEDIQKIKYPNKFEEDNSEEPSKPA